MCAMRVSAFKPAGDCWKFSIWDRPARLRADGTLEWAHLRVDALIGKTKQPPPDPAEGGSVEELFPQLRFAVREILVDYFVSRGAKTANQQQRYLEFLEDKSLAAAL